jgi:hypothetical protein
MKIETKQMLIYLPEKTIKEVKIAAVHLETTASKYINEAILDRLEKDMTKIESLKNR